MRLRRVHLPILATICGAAALIAACGGGGPPAVRVVASSPVATTPSATPAASACTTFATTADPFLLRVVDKERGLPGDYTPTDLQAIASHWTTPGYADARMRAIAVQPMTELLAAAEAQGVTLRIRSSFRSYGEQQRTFQFWIDQLGEAQARRESAPPGNSEHQLGTAADVIGPSVGWDLVSSFGDTSEGQWLAAHAAEHGFAISYPRDGEAITGYIYEPWHIRYIGRPCAAEWQASGLALVQFLERIAAPRSR